MFLEKDRCVDFVVHAFQHIPSLLVYVLLAVFLLLESSGIPLLNTTLLLCTGALAALGRLNLSLLMLISILGSVLGACSAYGLGRRYGEPFLLGAARLLRIEESKVALLQKWFHKAGGRMIFVSRIVPYIRPFSCFPAGIAAMPFARFLRAVLAGSIIWCVTFLLIGWELGPRWKLAVYLVRLYTVPMLVILLLLLILGFFFRRAINRSLKKYLAAYSE
jgi:membrane protein DedA with SNARE-associated domain